jgi:serine/threonine protein kinase/WD40 repeat protein
MNEETLFHLAREKPTGERAAFLDEACAGDAALRQRMEMLLRAHDASGSFLERPALEGMAAAGGALDQQALPPHHPESAAEAATLARGEPSLAGPAPGTKVRYFGDYELLEEIARGGMGVVYKARQVSLNRTVAVKMILSGQLAGEAEVKRFHAEAEAAAQLQHPNIVAIHEIGEHEGQHYFSMDCVEGEDLADRVRNGPLPACEAAGLLKTIAEAVEYAHRQGILHRDLKPSNVLIDQAGRPRITDFGLAKRMTADEGATQTGQVLGSPRYMPPEQAAGRRGEVGPASDVYSLGAILYHLLTGRAPFVAEAMQEILRQVLNDAPLAPRRLNPGVPRDLETICLKCLEKEPGHRYPTAAALAEDLGRFLNDEPVRARRVTAVERGSRWLYKRRRGLAAALGVTLAAGIVFGVIEWRQSLNRQRESLLEQARTISQTTAPDRRFPALAALEQAARIRPGPDLRNEYLRCLDMPALQPWPPPADGSTDGWWPKVSGCIVAGHFAFCGGDDRMVGVCQEAGDRKPTSAAWIFDSATGRKISRVPGAPEFMQVIALSGDGRWLLGRTPTDKIEPLSDGTWPIPSAAQFWDLSEQRLVGEIPDSKTLLQAAFDLKGGRMAVIRGDTSAFRPSRISVYELATLKVIGEWDSASPVIGLAFHPAQPLLAASVYDSSGGPETQRLVLWNLPKGDPAASLTLTSTGGVHHDREEAVPAFSADGRVLLVADRDGTIKAWDMMPRGTNDPPLEILSIPAHKGIVRAIRPSPDGRWLASAGMDGQLKIWDLTTGKLVIEETVEIWGYYFRRLCEQASLEWSPSGARLFSNAPDRLGFHAREFVPPISSSFRLVRGEASLAFSPDERYLSGGSFSALIDLETPSARPTWLVPGRSGGLQAFSPDSKTLWTATGPRKSAADPVESEQTGLGGREIARDQPDGTRQFKALGFEASGRRLAAGAESGFELKVVETDTGRECWTRTGQFTVPQSQGRHRAEFLATPGGGRLPLVFGTQPWCREHVIQSRDWATGDLVAQQRTKGTIDRFAFLRGGAFEAVPPSVWQDLGQAGMNAHDVEHGFIFSSNDAVAAISASNTVRIYQVDDWRLRATIPRSLQSAAGGDCRHGLTLNHEGTRVAGFDGTNDLKVWSAVDGTELGRVDGQRVGFWFVKSGKEDDALLLVRFSDYPALRVMSWIPGGEPRPVCTLEAEDVARVLVSVDGGRIVGIRQREEAGGASFHFEVWALPGGELAGKWTLTLAHPAMGTDRGSPRLSPDGKRLAFLHEYERDLVWEVESGRERLPLEGREALRFSRDGGYLLSGRRVFDLASQTVLFTARETGKEVRPQCVVLADGARLLAIGDNERLRLHDPRTGQTLSFPDPNEKNKTVDYLALPSGKLFAAACDGTASTLACAGEDGVIRLLNPRTGAERAAIPTGKMWNEVALSLGGRWLAAAGASGEIRVWELALVREKLRQAGLDWPEEKGR